MGLVVANNVSSLTAQHNLQRSSSALNQSLERLSSGFKINRGADGPAALVISEKQRAQIAGLEKAIENSSKAVAVVQTAEGALSEINNLLIRIRSLALDSANTGVNDTDALAANQAEIDNALDTINRIASNTQFANKKLLDGSAGFQGLTTDANVTFLKATSATSAGTYDVEVTTAASRATTDAATGQTTGLAADEILTINDVTVSLSTGMTQADVINRINEYTDQTGVIADANGGGGETRLYSVAFGSDATLTVVSNQADAVDSSGFGTTAVNVSGINIAGTIDGVAAVGNGNVLTATSGAADGVTLQFAADTGVDDAVSVSGVLGNVTVTDNSLTFQIGPNQNQTAKINIDRVSPNGLGIGLTNNQFSNLNEIDISSGAKAQDSLAVIDQAIDEITTMRGRLGAFQQNTLESTANNLRATLENSVNAESIIRDTDFASEIANFTKQQVLVQAGTSILSNANQSSQLVLSLL